ncbi:MAG TPA: zf-HC2 domain-containing protein [Armatimonadota bacterium]|jgi:hypothetical protein
MPDCPYEEENLSGFVDGELPVHQQQVLARHLMECSQCAEQAGRLLGAKYYLADKAPEPTPLSTAFWGHLEQAMVLVDAVAARSAARPLSPVLRKRILAGASAVVMLTVVAVALHLASQPPLVSPAALLQAHQGIVAQTASSFSPVSLGGARLPRAGHAWLPQMRLEQGLGAAGVTHEIFSVSALPLSFFSLSRSRLDIRRLQPIQTEQRTYYAGTDGRLSLLAFQNGEEWQVLTAEAPLSQLLLLAEWRPAPDLP